LSELVAACHACGREKERILLEGIYFIVLAFYIYINKKSEKDLFFLYFFFFLPMMASPSWMT
jgi:hypothetical protein